MIKVVNEEVNKKDSKNVTVCHDEKVRKNSRCLTVVHVYVNPFLFIKNKWLFITQRVSPPLKKCLDMLSEGNAAHLLLVCQPSADSNGSLAPFLFEFKLLGRV